MSHHKNSEKSPSKRHETKQNQQIYEKILVQLEPYYNVLNTLLTLTLIVVGISYIFRPGFIFAAAFDLASAIIGIIIMVKQHKWTLQRKMFLTAVLMLMFSVQSLYRGGVIGSGLIGLAMLIVVAMSFLKKTHGLVLTFISVGTLMAFTLLSYMGIFDLKKIPIERLRAPVEWFYQSIALALFALLCYMAIFTIKRMLIETLDQLQIKNVALTEQAALLEEQHSLLEQ